MVFFKNVSLLRDGKKLILKDLNLVSLKRIMNQNKYNTVILDYESGRFLFYDYINNISNKYDLYDLDTLSKSDETFEMIMLLKCDENNIKNKIDLAENYRIKNLLSVLNNENEQQQNIWMKQQEASNIVDYSKATINLNLSDIDEQQKRTNSQINYDKTIFQCDDDDSNRPTFDDIVKLDDAVLAFTDELEDDDNDDDDDVNEQGITSNNNNANEKNQFNTNNLTITNFANLTINNGASEKIDTTLLSSSENYIMSAITNLSNQFSRFETNVKKRLSIMEKSVEKRLLDSVYLITSDRLETRTFKANDSYLTLKFFRFVSKQLVKNYKDRWSPYNNNIKKLSLKPRCIEINLLGFGILDKCKYKDQNKQYSIESPTSLYVNNKTNYRLSYVSQCCNNFGKPLTHILVFEGTTSPVYFETELFKQIHSSSYYNKKITSMKNLLRKLLQLERMIFFLTFYYKIDFSQFFAGLICFHFYHNSHIDTSLLLKNIMSSKFNEAIPLLNRLYLIDQFILTY
ncbi:unnamed protein product [Didymodactylos carnosus]|uniref:Uncharacterized protein n=1 Tax=Didymodactylos carnosus TaxID=1234261 RepID=A0A815S1B9_9BILA|nr:unnamed protein product [Didymodactylos carnosus]CAF1485640.1 unnamed protein product [Didymodactylos carnosus]CAF3649499.1 unnamed protein product [Didymodactylos carnosus]CAF4349748.1 unnamed protein product [Didymodactylos carnosus]